MFSSDDSLEASSCEGGLMADEGAPKCNIRDSGTDGMYLGFFPLATKLPTMIWSCTYRRLEQ